MPDIEQISFEIYDGDNSRHIEHADALEAMRVEENPEMLPMGSDVLRGHALGVLASTGSTAVGYNGVIFEYDEDDMVEIGGLYVNPTFRGHGLVKQLKAVLFREMRADEDISKASKIVTFANGSSLPLNMDLGFRVAKRDEIPEAGLVNCMSCSEVSKTRQAGKLCCHTVLIINAEDLPELPLPANA